MNDDELRAQLERRSHAAPFRAADLLPGINRAIGVPVRAKPARFARWAPLAGLAAAAALVLVLVVVIPRSPIGGSVPTSSPGSATSSPDVTASSPSISTAHSGDFTLTLVSDKRSYWPGEPINVHAELLYTGVEPSVTLVGSGSGLVTFPIEQLDYDFRLDPVMTADCSPYSLERGAPLRIPLSKSFSSDESDPNKDRLRSFWADPGLPMWPGQWRVSAAADFYVDECGGREIRVDTSLLFDVTAAGTTVAPESPTPSPTATTPAPETSPTPPSTSNRFECAEPPLPPDATLSPGPVPIVIDETGLIVSCAQTDALTELIGSISVSNPFGPEGLEVMWVHGPCDAGIVFTFRSAGNGYELVGDRPSEPCEPGTGLPLYLTFSTSMPAETVDPSLVGSSPSSPPTSPSLPPPTPVVPGATLPPPVQSTATPNSSLSVRERIDRYWSDQGDVDCLGMAAPQSIEELAGLSDLIVIGRPVGAQPWVDAPYPLPNSLITFLVTKILKGNLNYEPADFVQIYVEGLPPGTVADVDHLLLLSLLPDREVFYHLSAGWMSVYANVDGRVVTPEYAAIKRVYHDSIFSLAFDGTSFENLVTRLTNGGSTAATMQMLARHGYFAC